MWKKCVNKDGDIDECNAQEWSKRLMIGYLKNTVLALHGPILKFNFHLIQAS
jgi:hypothetical protein|tara:strand:- start:1878 stop:2033 length:156 start_codon:yes stop_codon:yes gene_type:complete